MSGTGVTVTTAQVTGPTRTPVQSPTDGFHLYFTNPGGRYGNGRGGLPEGIDVRGGRGDGGYVLAAGSVLDRRAYAGKPELQELVGDGKAYTIYNDAPVLDPSAWLLEELHRKPRRKRTSGEACHGLLRELARGRRCWPGWSPGHALVCGRRTGTAKAGHRRHTPLAV